ncbi:hypothetical protein HU200_060386 [Digitaria exilis]|uniref:Pectinesterase inhibitor domain-containing protein n=1 Tax=Digitaria exilis TaxID=1010633 RepID=A0A835E1R6_9POAL|nr:hypothetical protein HU200_060386 [Digitaria exilis]CAB3476570.1 unnamed protein product [Digitaria exilis]
MATRLNTAPQANTKPLLAAILCAAAIAASFLPGSSAATAASSSPPSQLMIQTCSKTSNEHLCINLLQSNNRSSAATTVHDLAVVAVTAARRSALRGRILWLDLSYQAKARASSSSSSSSVADRLVARCAALYEECVSAGAKAVGRVTFMPPAYDARVAHAVSDLRRFPERCQGIFDERNLVSPLEKVNTEAVEKLRVAEEIVRLLR